MTEYIIALMDLLEAEGRELRRTVMRTGIGLVCLAVAGLVAVIGLCFCLWAVYQALAAMVGPATAAMIVGLLMLSLAGLIAWIAMRLAR
ncbi:MAG: phage holin family protein [Pseudomonadota bacterium]